jgi:hypothetical protein
MIDPKQLPALDTDWDRPIPKEPRSTADFINDTWLHRNNPVYVLLPEEFQILQSKTLKGWFWRLMLKMIRRKSSAAVNPLSAMDQEALSAFFDPTVPSESERTMAHYLAIASKWATPTTPPAEVDPSACATTCGCTEFHSPPPRKPRKRHTKKPTKKSPRSK